MKNKTTAIVLAALMVFGLLAYFVFYVPHENQIAYQQGVECNNLVAKAEAAYEAKTGNVPGVSFNAPGAHFNKRMNTCLGSFTGKEYVVINATTNRFDVTKWIVDVVSNATILSSVTSTLTSQNTSTTTLNSGVSADDFMLQENT